MPKAQEIISFREEYSYLSNFYHASITYNGLTYLNNEAAFQAQKSIDRSEQETFTMLSPDSKKQLEMMLMSSSEPFPALISSSGTL